MNANRNEVEIHIVPCDRSDVSEETKRRLVYFATRAPSGHNSQPWLYRFGANSIQVHPDYSRSLPVVDPDHRELFVSIGCATENLVIAASHFDLIAESSLRTDFREPFIETSFRYSEDLNEHPLFPYIELRQTNRRVYDNRRLTSRQLGELENVELPTGISAQFIARGTALFEKIKGRITAGNEIQMNDNAFKDELLEWIRFNRNQALENKDGLTHATMNAPAMPEFFGRWLVGRFLNPVSQAVSDLKKIQSSSHLVVISANTNDVMQWIDTGRYLQRLLLTMTSMDIAAAYMNPPCELPELRDQLGEMVGRAVPMIILRIGFAERAACSPRRPIDDVVKSLAN